MTPTANEILQDRAIVRAIELQRLGNAEAKRVVEFLNREVLPDVRARLAARLEQIAATGVDRGPATTARLNQLKTEIETIVTAQFEAIASDQVIDRLPRVGAVEAASQVKSIDIAISPPQPVIAGIRMTAALPPTSTIRAIIDAQPMQGAPIRAWWKDLGEGYAKQLDRSVRRGLIEGRTPQQIIRQVAGAKDERGNLFAKTRREAATLVRTAVNDISSKVRHETYRANSRLVKGYKIVATLDTRTSSICRFQDGKVYETDKGPLPPFHFGCRTTTVSVLRSLKELGLSKGEQAKLPPGFRASMDGIVAGDLTYYEWLKQQPAAIQDDVLGPTRGRIWRSGAIGAEQLTDSFGGLLTLAELEKRHGVKLPT